MKSIFPVLFLILLFACQKDELFEKKSRLFGKWRVVEYTHKDYTNGELLDSETESIEGEATIVFQTDHTYSAKDEDDLILGRFLNQYEGVWRLRDAGMVLYFDLGVNEWPDEPFYGSKAIYFQIKELSQERMVLTRSKIEEEDNIKTEELREITLTR